MANDRPAPDASERELALWQLTRLRDSERFLGVLKAARVRGARDVLDTPDYVDRHAARLKALYQSDSDDEMPVSAATAAKIKAILQRDLLSGPEEFIEKALAAYLERNPERIVPEWQSTFDAARDEIEGRTTGSFEAGFIAKLANEARAELAQQIEAPGRASERGERGD